MCAQHGLVCLVSRVQGEGDGGGRATSVCVLHPNLLDVAA